MWRDKTQLCLFAFSLTSTNTHFSQQSGDWNRIVTLKKTTEARGRWWGKTCLDCFYAFTFRYTSSLWAMKQFGQIFETYFFWNFGWYLQNDLARVRWVRRATLLAVVVGKFSNIPPQWYCFFSFVRKWRRNHFLCELLPVVKISSIKCSFDPRHYHNRAIIVASHISEDDVFWVATRLKPASWGLPWCARPFAPVFIYFYYFFVCLFFTTVYMAIFLPETKLTLDYVQLTLSLAIFLIHL